MTVMHDLAVIGVGNMGVSVLGAFLKRAASCVAIDIDRAKIAELAEGRTVVPESGAAEVFAKAVREKKLVASTDLADVKKARCVFVGVQTPYKGDRCDYTALRKVLRGLAEVAPRGQAIVIGSTVFPGGIKAELLPELRGRDDLALVYEPVFLRAGFGIDDYTNPGKLIFGVSDPENPAPVLRDVFCPIIDAKPVFTKWESAEWIKMVHNAWMGVKVCFANEIDVLCRGFDADTEEVLRHTFEEGPKGRLMTLSHMMPGPPYSGPCLPKDAIVLGGLLQDHQASWMRGRSVLEALRTSNECFTEDLVDRWITAGRVTGKPLGIVGVAFRPDFNEIRGSLALPFIRRAKKEGIEVLAYDPMFVGIERPAFQLAARQDVEVEGLFETVTYALEDVWRRSGAVLVNRALQPDEWRRIADLPEPFVLDLYRNEKTWNGGRTEPV